jgi:hypothetical protein
LEDDDAAFNEVADGFIHGGLVDLTDANAGTDEKQVCDLSMATPANLQKRRQANLDL